MLKRIKISAPDYIKEHPYLDKHISEFDAWFGKAMAQLVEEEQIVLVLSVKHYIDKLTAILDDSVVIIDESKE